MDEYQLLKGQTFLAGIVVMNALQFGYIALQVLLFQVPIGDLGELFVVYIVFNTTEIFVYLLWMLSYGAEINDLDTYLKAALIRINKDVGRMQVYAINRKMFKLDRGDGKVPKIYILDEIQSDDGSGDTWYRSEQTGQVFKSIEKLEPISEYLEARLEFHN